MGFVLCLIFIIFVVILLIKYIADEERSQVEEEQSQVEESITLFNDKTPYEVFLETYRGKLVDFFECGDDDTFHRWVRQHKKGLIQLVGVENYDTKAIALSIESILQYQGLTHPTRFFTGKEYRQIMAEEGCLVYIEDEDNVVLLFIGTQEEFKHYKENQENNRLELNKKLGTMHIKDEIK